MDKKTDTKTVKAQPEKKAKRIFAKQFVLGLIIGIVVTLLTVAIAIGIYIKSRMPSAEQTILMGRFEENIRPYGYSVSQGTLTQNGSTVYQILPNGDICTVFAGEDGAISGVGLAMPGSGEEAKVRQLLLISLLNMSIYKDMDINKTTELLEQMLASDGRYSYAGYNWTLMTNSGSTYFFIMEEGQGEEENQVMSTVNAPKKDITYLLGGKFDVAQAFLGESVQIISDNTRYFSDSGVSVVYSRDNNDVIYIDCDGTGTDGNIYKICELYCGMKRDDVREALSEQGLSAEEGDEVWTVDRTENGKKTELAITFDNEKAIVVSYTIIN